MSEEIHKIYNMPDVFSDYYSLIREKMKSENGLTLIISKKSIKKLIDNCDKTLDISQDINNIRFFNNIDISEDYYKYKNFLFTRTIDPVIPLFSDESYDVYINNKKVNLRCFLSTMEENFSPITIELDFPIQPETFELKIFLKKEGKLYWDFKKDTGMITNIQFLKSQFEKERHLYVNKYYYNSYSNLNSNANVENLDVDYYVMLFYKAFKKFFKDKELMYNYKMIPYMEDTENSINFCGYNEVIQVKIIKEFLTQSLSNIIFKNEVDFLLKLDSNNKEKYNLFKKMIQVLND